MTRKEELYAKEQREIAERIIAILELDERHSVWLGDLDTDQRRQNLILSQLQDIRRFFAFDNIQGASDPRGMKRPWLSIAKGVTSPFYDWYRTEEQRDRKRTSRFFIIPKSRSTEVRLIPGKKNLKSRYTDGHRKRTPGSGTSTIQDDQNQPGRDREISGDDHQDI